MRSERRLATFAVVALLAGAVLAEELPPPPAPDADFFAARVEPWVEAHCATCHRTGGGDFRLPGAADARADFRAVLPFLDAERPGESPLLRKVLALSDGGVRHAGGAFLHADDEAYETLLDFACGATPTNLAPEAWVEETVVHAVPGETVVIDGSYSYDRDRDDRLVHRWAIRAAPPGTHARLGDARSARVRFTADEPGTYVLRLRVGDGKAWSAPCDVVVETYGGAAAAEVDPAVPSGLAEVDPERLRRVRRLYLDVLARSPTPGEVRAAETLAWRDLVALLLGRPEAARATVAQAEAGLGLPGVDRPRPAGLDDLVARLAAGTATPLDAEAAVSGAPPVDAAAVLARRLGRFLGSGEVARRMPAALEAARAGGAAWRAFLVERLAGGAYVDAALLRAKDDVTFARGLWVDLFGRPPTEREWGALWRAIQVLPGRSAPRAAVVKLLLDSGQVPLPLLVDIADARAWIADRFLRYLGRAPDAAEVEAYGKALLAPAGGPEVVVRALLTGPEYACR